MGRQAVKDRDRRMEALVPALRRFAWSLTRNADEADDLVQDCLEHALGAWQRRHGDGNLRAWLFAILYNLYVSGRRRLARRARLLEQVAQFGEVATPAGGPDSTVQCAEVLGQVDTLPEEQRAVLLLVGVEGLSYEETAEVLDVPVGTVMSRLSRGRERLRRMAEEQQAPVAALRRVV
ncbi:sigma-70 family RNA polymerase sigma factor [Falsiroseomonas sp.]|uniref:sigma-70 family RNA polymerase sigma factor n=1 Tax=Falsiroseomonas sp. TaxID=2870721 RepID=UPI00356B14C3